LESIIMRTIRSRSVLTPLVLVCAFVLAGGRAASARSGETALTLRANPAIAAPGGVFAVVLRTYAPRPIRQGQVLVKVVSRPAAVAAVRGGGRLDHVAGLAKVRAGQSSSAAPIATLLSATVFSVAGDSVSQASQSSNSLGQQALVKFQSPSVGINAADGPMVVFLFQLDPSVAPGQVFDLQVDPSVSSLLDGAGQRIVIDPRAGTLTVRAPGSPLTLAAEGGDAVAGTTAVLGVQTREPFLISSGRVALRYDPSVAAGPPVVRIDPRYGNATFTADSPEPGLLIVDFQSPDNTLNSVPGSFIGVSLPLAPDAVAGSSSPVSLDPSQTWLVDRYGKELPLFFEAGALLIK
jgi:hypothetical protein